MTRWTRYWFADGGRAAAAAARIAIAAAVLMSLAHLASHVSLAEIVHAPALYRPVGIWHLAGHAPPPLWVVGSLWVIAWAATMAMLVGAATRTSTAVSLVASVALASLSFAQAKTWSHQYNIVFIAQLAFLGARGGDAWSADALVRRLRRRPPAVAVRGYQWSVRLVQLAVALMFAGAAFHKLLHGHFTLRWALSDSLRNHLLVRFDLAGLPRPALVDWMIDHAWRYRTAALLNLITQILPLLACFLMRRPVLRALCGAFFVIETLALGAVISLWNLHWLPLAAVFVDWDALIGWLARRPAAAEPAEPSPTARRPPRITRWFIALFVAYDVVTSFVPALDQWLDTYPFSGFPMFATVRARAPYDEHLPYAVAADHFEVVSDRPIDAPIQLWFDYRHRGMEQLREPARLRAKLEQLVADARARYPDRGIHGVRLYLTIFQAPAYPAPAHFEPHPIAIVGELVDGTFRTALGRLDGDHAIPSPAGVDLGGARFVYYRDDAPEPITMTGDRVGPGDPIYAVAIAKDGLPWLIATHADWHWQ